MVHRADAAGAVRHLLTENHRDEVVLVVDDEPVEQWAFADWLAEQCAVSFPPKRDRRTTRRREHIETAKRRIPTSSHLERPLPNCGKELDGLDFR